MGEPVVDDETFASLYRREFMRAVRLAHLLTGSIEIAEDITQDVFVRLGAKLAAIEQPAAYLTRSITNACHNWHRAQGRAARRNAQLVTRLVSDEPELDVLLELVDRLPFRQRTVLVARYWLDMSEAEIADLVGCRQGTVKSLAARALRTLRGQLP